MFETYDWPLQSEDSLCRIWASETMVLSSSDPRPPDFPGLDPEELGRHAQVVHRALGTRRTKSANLPAPAHTPR